MGSLGILGSTDPVVTTMHPSGKQQLGVGVDRDIDWERYGLVHHLHDSQKAVGTGGSSRNGDDEDDDGFYQGRNPKENDLFAEDQSLTSKPWWKANFFISEPVLFGTWDGVFTSCMINIFGVIVFLRSGWMVAQAGIGMTVLIMFTALSIVMVTVFAAIGICGRCQIERGGVYFIISHVLGSRFGGAIGLIYCFGQAVGSAIHIIGFGETMGQVFKLDNVWLERFLGIAVLLLLIAINLVGVVWVIKLQFILLLMLFLAALDFTVGSFVGEDIPHGVDGYYSYNFWNNSGPAYSEGCSWFTVFGVFFPTMTGILAGINMSGDLRNPTRDIPVGTLSALGVSSLLYLVFVLVLGATCQRWALRTDFLIAEKVSGIGFFLLAGLYIASLSSCLGGLYGTPRVLQCIASENVIPFMRFLGRGRGPNQVPVMATLVVGTVTLIFVLIGDINTLAPIVAMPFLLAYTATNYSYFSLAMTFDMQKQREDRMRIQGLLSPTFDKVITKSPGSDYGSVKEGKDKGTEKNSDLDTLFPERTKHRPSVKRQYSSQTSSLVSSPDEHSSIRSEEGSCRSSCGEKNSRNIDARDSCEGITDLSQLIPKGYSSGITMKSRIWYYAMSNRWISLLGVLANLMVMFFVQWVYALVNILVMCLLYFYISRVNPGVQPGIAQFKMFPWIKYGLFRIIGRESPEYNHVIVTPMHPGVEVMAAQLTVDNEDYAARERYHQSSVLHGSKLSAFEDD